MKRYFSIILPKLILSVVCLCSSLAHAYEQIETDLSMGSIILTTQFEGDGEELLLWLPSERGMRGDYKSVAMNMAAMGTDVWLLDLHSSYMVPESRSSLAKFPREDLIELLEVIERKGFSKLSFFAAGRGAVLAIEIARLWQQKHPDSDFLNGYVFTTPHLIVAQPEMGQSAEYLPVAKQTILPVYLVQPEYSTKYAHSQKIVDVLSTGGSQVFVQLLKGVAGGFYARSEKDLSKADLEAKEKLPEQIESALALMKRMPVSKRAPTTTLPNLAKTSKGAFRGKTLKPFKGNPDAPMIMLESLYGGQKTLEDYRGDIVLLNFWASWCGPCVEEIPSLSRLVTRLNGKAFKVVTVNIGEKEEHIKEFIKDLPVNFEILLDRESASVRNWNIYAYPSNYLLDKSGKIIYSYRGALEWDSPEIVEVIEAVL